MGDLARAHICLGATIPNIWSVSHQHLSGYPCLQTVIITKIYEMDQDSKYRNKKAQPSFPHLTLATIVKICNILETTEIDCGIDPQDLWDRPEFKILRQKCNIYIFIRNILETTEIDCGIDPQDLWDKPKFKISRQKCDIYIFIRNILETTAIDCGIDPQDLKNRPEFKKLRQKCNIYIFICNILETTEIDYGIDPHRQSVLLSRHSYTTHNIIAALEFLVNALGALWELLEVHGTPIVVKCMM